VTPVTLTEVDVYVKVTVMSEPAVDPAASAPPLLKIGEVARRYGVSTRALRFYEEIGLLRPGATTGGGFRLYGDDDLSRIEKILQLKGALNFTLDEIRQVIEDDDELAALRAEGLGTDDVAVRLGIVERYLAALDRQRRLVLDKRAQLDAYLDEIDAKAARVEAARRDLEHRAVPGA
jgi:DNA-binding transcriptional MerR regulator